jgi:hypothetical protein
MARGPHTEVTEDTEAFLDRGLRGYLGLGKEKMSSIRGLRVIRGSILPLLAVLCLLFPSSAKAQALTTSPDGPAYTLAASPGSIDGIDCITANDVNDEPLQICEDSSDPWNDLDEISPPSDDKATLPSRDDHLFSSFRLPPSSFSLTRSVGTIPAFLFSTHASFCLHEHLRERAPPSLV